MSSKGRGIHQVEQIISCPESFGSTPAHSAIHVAEVRPVRGDPGKQVMAEERCDLREELLDRAQDCKRSCGLGSPDSPLRRQHRL